MFEIDKITKNCFYWEKDKRGYTSFYRFHKNQFKEYKKDPTFDILSHSSAGIYLSFYTTGDEVSFDCKVISAAKFIAAFIKDFEIDKLKNFFLRLEKRIEENRELKKETRIRPIIRERHNNESFKFDGFDFVLNNENITFHEVSNGKIKFKIFNPNKEKVHIKIYFPLIFAVSIKNLQIKGEITYDTSEKDKILCIGDSITQGLFSGNSSLNYVARIGNSLNVEAMNQGVSGYMFNYKSLDGLESLPFKPKFITVAYGTNDWRKKNSLKQVREDMKLFYEKLVSIFENEKIFSFTPIWRDDIDKVSKVGSFYEIRKNIIEITKQYNNIQIIEGIDFVPHDTNFFADEYLHPNSDGFEHMAYNLTNELKDI